MLFGLQKHETLGTVNLKKSGIINIKKIFTKHIHYLFFRNPKNVIYTQKLLWTTLVKINNYN